MVLTTLQSQWGCLRFTDWTLFNQKTRMRYPGDRHVLPLFGPWRWAPYMRGKFYWKKYQNARSFFLSRTSKLNHQKQWNVVPKSTAKIDPSNKYNIFPSCLLTNHETPYNLKILCWASTHLFSQSLPFLHLQVCDLITARSSASFYRRVRGTPEADPGFLECLKVWGFALLISSHFFLNISSKWNNLVSLRPNYFLCIGYLKTEEGRGVERTPWNPSGSATVHRALMLVCKGLTAFIGRQARFNRGGSRISPFISIANKND